MVPMSTADLINEIEVYAKASDLAPATVVSRAVSNGRLYGRLKKGYGCHLDTACRIREYMSKHPPEQSRQGATA